MVVADLLAIFVVKRGCSRETPASPTAFLRGVVVSACEKVREDTICRGVVTKQVAGVHAGNAV